VCWNQNERSFEGGENWVLILFRIAKRRVFCESVEYTVIQKKAMDSCTDIGEREID